MKNRRVAFWGGWGFVLSFVMVVSTALSEPVNLLSLQEGALPVVTPPTYGGWSAAYLLDESPVSGWACEQGSIDENVFVFELAETGAIEGFEFDNAEVDADGAGARQIMVEVSTISQRSGFIKVLEASLAEKSGGQKFSLPEKPPARWVRLTLRSNFGSPEWTELFSFRGYGERPRSTPISDISGTYETDYAAFHVRQQGSALIGCYEFNEGVLTGGIEGRVMKIAWREAGGADNGGPAVMVFSPDGKSFKGYYWRLGKELEAPDGSWDGKKVTAVVGGCPHWTGSVGAQARRCLMEEKRTRLYGIHFDFNSATLQAGSKPVLDDVVAVLKAELSWKLTIEGHTDDVGSDARNQLLSSQRAEAVKAYFIGSGISAERLRTAGYGESRPVSANDTELGRAQNRRVELVRE